MEKEWIDENWKGITDREIPSIILSHFADKVLTEAAKANCLFCRTNGLPIVKGTDWYHKGSGLVNAGYTSCRSGVIWNLLGNKEPYLEAHSTLPPPKRERLSEL